MIDISNERLQATCTHPLMIVYILLFALASGSAFLVGQDMSIMVLTILPFSNNLSNPGEPRSTPGKIQQSDASYFNFNRSIFRTVLLFQIW